MKWFFMQFEKKIFCNKSNIFYSSNNLKRVVESDYLFYYGEYIS